MTIRPGLPALLALLLAAAPAAAEPKTDGPARTHAIDMIVIHAVSGPVCEKGKLVFDPPAVDPDDAGWWKRLLDKEPVTGIHYVIGRAGNVAIGIPEDQVANHASGANARSIGIELVNRGDGIEPFSEAQIAALIDLVRQIRTRYAIAPGAIITHAHADQRTCTCGGASYHRRVDPNTAFPLDRVRAALAAPDESLAPPADFKPLTGAVDGDLCANR